MSVTRGFTAAAATARMKMTAAGVAAIALAASVAGAQVYDARDDFWYSGADGNGTPNGVTSQNSWSYGSFDGTNYVPFTLEQYFDLGGGNKLYTHRFSPDTEPVIGWASTAWFADAPPPAYLFAHPNPTTPAVVQWTAPADATISLAGSFLHPDGAQLSQQNVGVIKVSNGVPTTILSDRVITGGGQNVARFHANSITVKAGDTLNFYVGPGPDGFASEGTGIRAHITTEPAAVVESQYRLGQSIGAHRDSGGAIVGAFRLGFYDGAGGDSFTLFQRTSTQEAGFEVDKYAVGDGSGDPNVLYNHAAEPQVFEQFTLQPGMTAMGPYLGPAVARFVAPEAGTYTVSALFTKIQNVNDPAQAQVYVNGSSTPVFSQVAGFDGVPYGGKFTLAQGETIDLVVSGSNTGFGNGTTSLSAVVTAGELTDVNNDQVVNGLDIDQILTATAGPASTAALRFDMNGDAVVTPTANSAASDADQWVRTLMHSQYGDATLDGKVSFDDLLVLARNYNRPTGAGWSDGSFDGDGAVTFNDLLTLAKNYNFGTQGSAASFDGDWALAQSLVPEPTSMISLLGLGALAFRRRARR